MSAPARLIAVRCSRATAGPSIQPRAAAALTIAYSPDTWYAATGTSNLGAHGRDDVEIRERGLDHHDVGALGDVERDLLERLAPVVRILLVALAVAAAHDRHVDCVAERAVERGRVLGRVGEDRDLAVAIAVERRADGGDLAVHHAAGGRRRRRPRRACATATRA